MAKPWRRTPRPVGWVAATAVSGVVIAETAAKREFQEEAGAAGAARAKSVEAEATQRRKCQQRPLWGRSAAEYCGSSGL